MSVVTGLTVTTNSPLRGGTVGVAYSTVLAAAGADWTHVVKTTIYLVDMADFAAVNEVYASHLQGEPPARATVQVAALPKAARVEIDAVAVL